MSDDEQDFPESSQAPESVGTGSTDVRTEIPIAAYVWSSIFQQDDHKCVTFENPVTGPTWNYSDNEIEMKDKLVRRSDAYYYAGRQFVRGEKRERERIKELIRNKIENIEVNPVDEEIATKQSQVLQELLHEIEKPDNEKKNAEEDS